MYSKIEQRFTGIYAIIVSIELICGTFESLATLHYFTKPLIVISLLLFFVTQSQHLNKTTKTLMILALVFSLVGDVALLFDAIKPIYFIIGLASFLLAHVMYVLVFLKQRNTHKKPLGFILIMLGYAALLFYILKDGLGDLLLPVIVYMFVILSMSTSAYLRQKLNNTISYNWVFIGAILFMISDSILALDKFYQPLTLSSISIMLTYALAQYCIVIGILKLPSNSR
ncbi:lysoplasmalogenase [Psychroserpens ponticola]|uniref:Lysoplasmalogenase n=1 Tax=Psychroserpens ponticola TaxID=2932268 RepID=A0ABY7S024_9FLAO|nr:lysoplasmalogenase [Psychroserpens ponticola]WCO02643.1 lysoplasmalogenase [Psychroserpens ponticola]